MAEDVDQRFVCASDALAERGDGVRFLVEWREEVIPAFVVRADGLARAFLNRCAHVPMELDWNAGKFFDRAKDVLVCSTHGALYDPASGRCRGGPCLGSGLVPIDIVERDGSVYMTDPQLKGPLQRDVG
jgi:nitrite reductase/ring-hydroxylating ferredoxin subunit